MKHASVQLAEGRRLTIDQTRVCEVNLERSVTAAEETTGLVLHRFDC